MITVLLAVLPVFLLIFLGAGLHRLGFPGPALWQPLERLVYFLLFPSLIVSTLAGADLSGLGVAAMAAALVLALLTMMGVLLALRPVLGVDGPAFTSVVQGTVRMNTYIGLALCAALYGDTGLTAAAVAVAAIVPVVNILCVGSLARYGAVGQLTLLGTLGRLARNPLIIACVVGLGLQGSGVGLPPVLAPTLEILGRAALALGLLAVGAGLDFTALRGAGRIAGYTSTLKLVALPAVTGVACLAFGVGGVAAAVAVLFNGLPTAPSAFILARQMGGDHRLMAGLITLQTGLALISLPLIITGAETLLP